MEGLKSVLGSIKENIKTEIYNLKQLKGEKLQFFVDTFEIKEDAEIWFNQYNIVIVDPEIHQALLPYLPSGSLVAEIKFPELNQYLWVHQYFNARIFDEALN